MQQAIAAQLIAAYDSLSAQAAQLTDFYNQSEDRLLAQGGGNIVRVDVNKLFAEAIANPAQFGFANTAGMACPPGVSSAVCRSDMPGFDASQSYLFSDHFHPSPQAHLLIADYIQAVLDGPAQVVALNQATAAMARDSRATLDSRFQQLRNGDNPQDRWACSAVTPASTTTMPITGRRGRQCHYPQPDRRRGLSADRQLVNRRVDRRFQRRSASFQPL